MSDLKQQMEQALMDLRVYVNPAPGVATGHWLFTPGIPAIVEAIMPLIEAKLPPETTPSAETLEALNTLEQAAIGYCHLYERVDSARASRIAGMEMLASSIRAALSSPRRAGEAQPFTQRDVLNMAALAYTDIEDVRVETLVDMLRAYAELLRRCGGEGRGVSR